MSETFDRFLLSRARRGDHGAFDKLVQVHNTRLRQIAGNYRPWGWRENDYDADDVWSKVLEGLWIAVRRHEANRGSFIHLASVVIRNELVADLRYRRRPHRWTEDTPLRLTGGADDTFEIQAPSWAFGADPLRVVIHREDLRRGWEAMTARQQAAINELLADYDDRHHDNTHYQLCRRGREAALHAIHNPDPPVRRCEHCNTPLAPGRQSNARYCDETCHAKARWQAKKQQRRAAAA